MKNTKKQNKVIDLIYKIIFTLLILVIVSVFWTEKNFNNLKFDEIVFQLSMPLRGTDMTLVYSFIFKSLLVSIVISIILLYFQNRKNLKKEIYFEIIYMEKSIKIYLLPLNKILYLLVLICISLYLANDKLYLFDYVKSQLNTSNFIEENYVDPNNVDITFPNQKRNLVYIYLESMENTYTTPENGGALKTDLIPELHELADENINFSNTDSYGGGMEAFSTTYTMGSMIGQSTGMPAKLNGSFMNKSSTFDILPGVTTIGDTLSKNGYNNVILFGADGGFSSKQAFYENHGNYKVMDLNYAKKHKMVDDKELVYWGYLDSYLFKFAKKEMLNLSKNKEPFNVILLTLNTHFEDGYFEEKICEKKYDESYANAISCSSYLIGEFIDWIKQQDFYDNTTIVLTGDHLSMDSDFFNEIDEEYIRTTYNVIINSAVKPVKEKERIFTSLDMYPTTLASIGANIEGDRLGLGTNLFSETSTLPEKVGLDTFNLEISKKSKFYDDKFIKNKK